MTNHKSEDYKLTAVEYFQNHYPCVPSTDHMDYHQCTYRKIHNIPNPLRPCNPPRNFYTRVDLLDIFFYKFVFFFNIFHNCF